MAAARAVSVVGWPNEHLGYLPIILYSADFATRLDFKARSTISGPMPAQSPSVTPIRSFSLLMLLPVIVIEFAQPRTSVVATGRKSCRDVRTPQRGILPCCKTGVVESLVGALTRIASQSEWIRYVLTPSQC